MDQEKEPLLTINPRFNAGVLFLSKHLLTLIALIFFMTMCLNIENTEYGNIFIYFIIIIVCYLIYVVINIFKTKKQYRLVQYIFYDDKVMVLDKRKGHNDSVIYYNQMFDVVMTQNYIQKFFNQGDLVIKLSDAKFFSNNLVIFGIGNFDRTTQEIATIVYGNNERI